MNVPMVAQSAKRHKPRSFCHTYFICLGRARDEGRKYRVMLNKANTQLSKEMDLVKFIKRRRM